MSKATTLLDLFCDERFNGSSQGMDDILVESLHPPNDESPNYRKAVRTIKAISSLGYVHTYTCILKCSISFYFTSSADLYTLNVCKW